jgi:hypothetical protein
MSHPYQLLTHKFLGEWRSGKVRYRRFRPDQLGPDTEVPNIPIPARHTLLAEWLRTGRGLAFTDQSGKTHVPEKARLEGARQPANPEEQAIRVRERTQKLVKSTPTLIGRLLGVEIEYYPQGEAKAPKTPLADLGSDGSLDSGGAEMRKLTWTAADGRLHGLLKLTLKGKVNSKCGLHVHVDARHLGTKGLLGPVETYERLLDIQKHLKVLVPKSRHDNQYCKWMNNCRESRECEDSGNRYAAINYAAFKEHGTIEFRCQAGATNLVKIESWALLCQYLLNWCARPDSAIPSTWTQFVAILPEPLRSWAILRKQALHGTDVQLSDRSISAIAND